MCLGVIYWVCFVCMVYVCMWYDVSVVGFDDGMIYEEFNWLMEECCIFIQQCMCNESLEVMEFWACKIDKIEY